MAPFAPPMPAFAPALAVPLAATRPSACVSARRARAIRIAPVCVASEPTLSSSSAADAPAQVSASLPDDASVPTPELSAIQSLADVDEIAQLAAEFDLRDLRIVHEGVEVCITREGGRGFDSDGNLAPLPTAQTVVAPDAVAAMPVGYADDDDDDVVVDEEQLVTDVDAGQLAGEERAGDETGATEADQAAPPTDPDAVLDSDFVVTSNRVGFFLSGARNKPPLVTVGDRVAFNQPVCIIEQLGQQYVYLSEAAGTVVKVFIEDGEAVEFGSDIMVIRPD